MAVYNSIDTAPEGIDVLLKLEKDSVSDVIKSRKGSDGRWAMGLDALLSGAKPVGWLPVPS